MKQTDAERLEKLAEAYSTNADYCRHMAEIVRNPSSRGHWVRLAASSPRGEKITKLGRSPPEAIARLLLSELAREAKL
jgi:hypothetical protein